MRSWIVIPTSEADSTPAPNHGILGQVLVIDGTDFSHTYAAATWSGYYGIDGTSVSFFANRINGHDTG